MHCIDKNRETVIRLSTKGTGNQLVMSAMSVGIAVMICMCYLPQVGLIRSVVIYEELVLLQRSLGEEAFFLWGKALGSKWTPEKKQDYVAM